MLPILKAELQDSIFLADQNYIETVIAKKIATTREDIDAFMKATNLYHRGRKRWTRVPIKPTLESDLYDPFLAIFADVIRHFKLKDRKALRGHKYRVDHVEGSQGDSCAVKSSPDIFISGTGPNFHPEGVKVPEKPDYKYCGTPSEVKTEDNIDKERPVYVQVGVYARQCFIQQGNRKYVYSLVMTEKHAHLFQFDRSGVLRAQKVDIHNTPWDFIRLILLVCSPNVEVLGFDTSIFYEGKYRYIRTLDENRQSVCYRLKKNDPYFSRWAIRGRGTVCWVADDGKGNELLIKDSWQSEGRNKERDLLEEVKGLQGVGQMVAYQDGELSLSDLRGIEKTTLPEEHNFRDRFFFRITLQAYGKAIDKFESREQFLYAFRDAVKGHRNMWDKKILHRDISVNNILLGNKNAPDGDRGIVIDLDMAIHLDRENSLLNVDFRTGTRAFQSVLVLSSSRYGNFAPPHDHVDDLESFFYVFCWICAGYEGPNELVNPRPQVLSDWEQHNERVAADQKGAFLRDPIFELNVSLYFGPIFQDLLEKLHDLMGPHIKDKLTSLKAKTLPMRLMDLVERAKKDYDEFVEILDESIEKMEKENAARAAEPQESPSATEPSAPSSLYRARRGSGSSLKRQAQEQHGEGSPKTKKAKSHGPQKKSATRSRVSARRGSNSTNSIGR